MNPTRPRLIARFREDEPIEVYRGAPNTYLSEGCVRSMTEQMGEGWRHWIERPIADHEAIGRVVSIAPAPDGTPVDADLEITAVELSPELLAPAQRHDFTQ